MEDCILELCSLWMVWEGGSTNFLVLFLEGQGAESGAGRRRGYQSIFALGVPVTWSPKEPKITDFMFGK